MISRGKSESESQIYSDEKDRNFRLPFMSIGIIIIMIIIGLMWEDIVVLLLITLNALRKASNRFVFVEAHAHFGRSVINALHRARVSCKASQPRSSGLHG